VRVRPATVDDVAALVPLCEQLGYPSTVHQVDTRLRRVFGSGNQVVFVADIDGHIVGWIHVHESLTVESDPYAEIGGLVVDARGRGKGVGRALVEEARRWARRSGFQSLVVRSNVVRPESHPFYEQLGFRRTKTTHVYARDP
jgi:GNAT superfamily N-acetyltransferase